MALNNKRLEKMTEKSAQLEKRIRESLEEKKRIENEIKIMNYDNIVSVLKGHEIQLDDDFFEYYALIHKMRESGLSIGDLNVLADSLIKDKGEVLNENRSLV